MCALFKDLKFFQQGGLDTDTAMEYIAKNDYISAFNIRVTGTQQSEGGYVTNIESNRAIQPFISPSIGINRAIGVGAFESIRKTEGFILNTAGFNQIQELDYGTNTAISLYTDKQDSASSLSLMPLDPEYYVQVKLINDTFLLWADGKNEVGFTNLETLRNGGYGQLIQEDLTLIKPQCLYPITGTYINDAGRAANFLKGKLFQFIPQYVTEDYSYSAWGTWSKRIIPPQESTPTVGTDVSQNNGIIVSVFIGSIRVKTLNVACRYGTNIFNTIKSIDRVDIVALPHTDVDISNEVYEAYDPTTNMYSFVFYNESLNIPVAPVETDLLYDYIWPANAIEVLNGNIIALGDLNVGYPRPIVDATIRAVGYNPNITVPLNENPDPIYVIATFPGGVGSGAGNHRRVISVSYYGTPKTNDKLQIIIYDTTNASSVIYYSYTVPSAQDGDLGAVVSSFAQTIPDSSFVLNADGTVTIIFTGPSYFELQSAPITLFNAGVSISRSIHAILDNSSYQVALAHYDKWGRPFPISTGNSFIVQTQSYAQMLGATPQISWTLNNHIAPENAVVARWLITKNSTTISLLDVLGNILDYKGQWDAKTNMPNLSVGTGVVGDTYQISVPNSPDDTPQVNLGNGAQQFNTGDYVVYNGLSWDIVSKEFGDLTTGGDVLAIKINPLNIFNQRYTNSGANTVLSYSFTQGDRCTLHFYYTPGDFDAPTYLNNPTVDLSVLGYDTTSYIVKLEKSAVVSVGDLVGKDIYLRLSTPNVQQADDATINTTTVFYEIGEQINIVDGQYSVLNGNITEGDVYFKTRQYEGAVDPNTPYEVLATDFNFSDFYPSAFTSYGRPRTYYDELEQTERKASIITSQKYVLGSKKNGLTRFYPADIYGDADGQTSSSFGAIQVMWQRNNSLIIMQELKVGYAPVSISILEDNIQQKQYAISEKLLNNIQYNQTGNIGIGRNKESFDHYNNNGFFIDPNRSEPIKITISGLEVISDKMSKYFKTVIQQAVAQNKKITGFYDTFNNEYIVTIALDGNSLVSLPFSALYWDVFDNYTIVPSDIISLSTPANASASYNGTTGIATFIPNDGFVGNTVSTVQFNKPGGVGIKNICLNWTSGSDGVYSFSFAPLIDQELSTLVYSNSIMVGGNTIPAPISIIGGEYSVNEGTWVSSSNTVNSGDFVQVRQTTSPSNSTETTATLTISDVSADFDATTKAIVVSGYAVRSGTGFCLVDEVPLSDFDFLVLRYVWHPGSGVDLDTFTGFQDTGTPYDGDPTNRVNWVGYNQNPPPPGPPTIDHGTPPDNRIIPQGASLPYLNWGTDNTSDDGIEAILVDIKQFNMDFPSANNPVQVRMNAVWFNTVASGDISVEVTTYLGGTMTLVGTDFINTGGVTVDDVTLPVNVTLQSASSLIASSQDIAVLYYDKITNTASLSLV